jgi:hypothetical protein
MAFGEIIVSCISSAADFILEIFMKPLFFKAESKREKIRLWISLAALCIIVVLLVYSIVKKG